MRKEEFLTEFSDGKIAINCRTEEEAKKLLKLLEKYGFKWSNGDPLLKDTGWKIHKEKTCYTGENDNVWCGSINYFKTQYPEMEILPYKEIAHIIEPELKEEQEYTEENYHPKIPIEAEIILTDLLNTILNKPQPHIEINITIKIPKEIIETILKEKQEKLENPKDE